MAKKKYSYAEKKAYWVGVGMAIGKTQCKEDLERIEKSGLKQSLNAGFGTEMGHTPPSIKLFSRLPWYRFRCNRNHLRLSVRKGNAC